MASPDVVFCLTGDVRRNSRALRQLRALAGQGLQIDILAFGASPPGPSLASTAALHLFPFPVLSGPPFFAKAHRLFRQSTLQRAATVYHASDLYALPACAAAARRHAAYLVYDARELYAHVAATVGRPWVRRFWQAVEQRYIRQCDVVFTVSDRIADHLAGSYAVPRPTVVHNVPTPQNIVPSQALRSIVRVSDDDVLLLHQGQIRPDRGCDLLVEAMPEVRGASLVFLGDGPLRSTLQERSRHLGITNRVHFIDPVPPDELLSITASADVGVTLLEDTCLNHRFALPNKLFEYLHAGLPVLASDLPEIRDVVAGFDVGKVVDPTNRQALAATIQEMVNDAEARRRWAAHTPNVFETFSWERASERFLHQYASLFPPSASS